MYRLIVIASIVCFMIGSAQAVCNGTTSDECVQDCTCIWCYDYIQGFACHDKGFMCDEDMGWVLCPQDSPQIDWSALKDNNDDMLIVYIGIGVTGGMCVCCILIMGILQFDCCKTKKDKIRVMKFNNTFL